MAAPNPNIPIGSSSGTPGLGGAIGDAVKQAALTFGPKAITQRKAKIDGAVADADDGTPQPVKLGDQF
jgi:hypothetical protein